MKIRIRAHFLKCWILSAFMVCSIHLIGQQVDSSRITLNIGLHRNHYHPFNEGAVGIERVLLPPRVTAVGSVGINPISNKGWIIPVWRLNWRAELEFRYYFALRRHRQMSGFFTGVVVAYDHVGFYYRGGFAPNLIGRWFSFGPLVGYQHRFGAHLTAGAGFMVGIYPAYTTKIYNDSGQLTYSNSSGFGWQYLSFLRIGFTL